MDVTPLKSTLHFYILESSYFLSQKFFKNYATTLAPIYFKTQSKNREITGKLYLINRFMTIRYEILRLIKLNLIWRLVMNKFCINYFLHVRIYKHTTNRKISNYIQHLWPVSNLHQWKLWKQMVNLCSFLIYNS